MKMSGACQCGNITYTVSDEPLVTYACHCQDCQKRTGSAFAMGMFLPVAAVTVNGKLSEWQSLPDSGVSKSRYSCSNCGNIIYGIGSEQPDLLKLQPGTLDDTRAVHPEVHLWMQSAQAWFTLPEQVPQFATQPDNPIEFLAAATRYRKKIQDKKP